MIHQRSTRRYSRSIQGGLLVRVHACLSTEIYHDGGTVDVTFDGGISWHTVGTNLFGAIWFNTSFVTSFDVYKPGWTGLSNGWVQAKINMSVDTARNAVFRFDLSDETINKAGWAIDDFCFYVTDDPGRVYVVGEKNSNATLVLETSTRTQLLDMHNYRFRSSKKLM